jgi:DNA-binding transcriptional regulator YiaG
MDIGLSIMSRADVSLPKPKPNGYPTSPQTLGEHIKRKRLDRGISQAMAAQEMNVSEDCLSYWEQNRNHPRLYQYPAIIAFLGYYPFGHETETLGGKIKRYKYEHGVSNEKLAKQLGVDEGTVAKWEQNRRVPKAKQYKIVLSLIT